MVKTVLLAYEREQDLAALETHLQTRGLKVVRSRNGLEALEIIRRDAPHFLVSDVLLPRMDGFALCRRIKEDANLQHVPVVLFSMRVEGPKYEAFAAEVGADRFLQRGATLEDLAGVLDELGTGSGTMRMPALVPELLDRREQDRRKLAELEHRVRDLEALNLQLTAAERVAREKAERESKARTDFASTQSVRVRELLGRVRDLESTEQQLAGVESQARTAAQASQAAVEKIAALEAQLAGLQAARAADSQAAVEKVGALESRLAELQASRAADSRGGEETIAALEAQLAELHASRADESRAFAAQRSTLEARLAELQASRVEAQATATDALRAFSVQPVPAWVCERASGQLHLVNDAAAALFGVEPEKLPGRALGELLSGFQLAGEGPAAGEATLQRPDGTPLMLEIRRQPVSFSGRESWLMVARDVTAERIARAQLAEQAAHARVLEQMPQPCCLADPEGRLRYANAAFVELLGLEPARLAGASLAQFEVKAAGDSTIRSVAIAGHGLMTQQCRWRRSDGALLDVELASVITEDPPGLRICVVRDVTRQALAAVREQQDVKRIVGLLELTQRAHSLTEPEIFAHSLELLQQLTGSESAYVFLSLPEATQLELAARRDRFSGAEVLSVLSRWRGTPPEGGALFECLRSQRPVLREAPESSGMLHDAGLPDSWRRQLATPILDGGRIAGVLLVADKPDAYDEDDRRHAAHVADGLWKLLRRRRSDAEIVSAMDHMERVMFGAIEALAALAEAQDGCKTGRSRRVADLAAGIGTGLGLPGHTVRGLRVMAQLADVGMLQIPRELLWRPGMLTAAEFDLVRTHAERGAESLRRIEFPWPVAEVVRQHHERLDGSGYPRGLRGEEILLEARIVAVADTVEAMLSPRPHRAALSVPACIDELHAQAGRRYDARVVNACVKLLRERENPGPAETATETGPPAGQRIA